MITGRDLSRHGIVEAASIHVGAGEFVVLLGPNGAGKTTLLRMLLGLAQPDAGHADIGGDPAHRLSASQRARRVSYLPQTRTIAWPAAVRDVIALGRYAYGAAPGRLGSGDAAAVDRAIDACDVRDLADRRVDTLSGGELARVHIARALAAETPLIIADEPIASLDPRHQHRILDLLRDFVMSGGGVLAVLHDVPLAGRYADRLVWMKDGRIVSNGTVHATLTATRIADVYGVAARVAGVDVVIEGAI